MCLLTTVYCHVGGIIQKFKFCAIVVTSRFDQLFLEIVLLETELAT